MTSADDLTTESDVEQKVLYPLLTLTPPLGLGLRVAEVFTKPNIRRFTLGKGKSAKLYYPDYVAVVDGKPVLIVEAKAPGEDLDAALAEARLYATKINEHYPAGSNPCAVVIASDGLRTICSRWDSVEQQHEFALPDIGPTSQRFATFVEANHRGALARYVRRARSRRPNFRCLNLLGGTSVRNENIGHNTFGSALALDFRHLFRPTTLHERAYVVRNAYVMSRRRERYVEPIHRLIREAATPTVAHLPVLSDSENPVEVINTLQKGRDLEHQIMLLVGSVGSGKSTFVDYLVNVALPSDVIDKTLWVRVDLNNAPLDDHEASSWLLSRILDEFRFSAPEIDFDDANTIQKVFGPEIRVFQKGPVSLLPSESFAYKERLVDHLITLQQNAAVSVRAHSRFLCSPKSRLLVVVMDNCDKRDRDHQLLMFQLANWLQSEVKCLVVLPIRDTTYDLHRHQAPLDTALKDLVFRIEPPQFTKVLSSRVALALKELVARESTKLNYTLPNGIRVEYPASDQGMYLASILRSLYEHDRFVRQVMSGLAGRDIRRALEIFMDFCQSGYISEGEILKIRHASGNYTLPFSVVSAVLLRMHRRFYDGDESHVKNVLQADAEDDPPDHFARLAVLRRLAQLRTVNGPSGTRGYHPASTVASFLVMHGHATEPVTEAMHYLLANGCIAAEHLRVDRLADEDLISISSAGAVHLELLKSPRYLAACAEDTWVSNQRLAERVRVRITRTRLAHLSDLVVVRNARDFVDYLHESYKSRPLELESVLETSDEYDVGRYMTLVEEALIEAEQDIARASGRGRAYIGNLAYAAHETDVMAAFSAAGFEPVAVEVLRDPASGRSRGGAIVSFGDEAVLTKALIQMDGARVLGRPIRMDLPHRPRARNSGPRER